MTPARILVVEDDRVVARDIQQQLVKNGHTVVGVTDCGEDAVALALERQPELVLMDIRLQGDLDGVDAAAQIRSRCQIPIIYLTAHADEQTVKRAAATQPFGYLIKPFEDSQLLTSIEIALNKSAAEQAALLRNLNQRLQTALEGSGVVVWEMELPDHTLETARVVPANYEMYGLAPGRPISFWELADRWHPEDRPRFLAGIVDYLEGRKSHYEDIVRSRRADGSYRWRLARGIAVRDEKGRPIQFFGTSSDITERVLAEEALRQSEERYRATFENAAAGIVHVDLETRRLLRVNDRYCEMTGFSRDELLAADRFDLTRGGPDIEDLFAVLGANHVPRFTSERRMVRKDGSPVWLSLTVSKVRESPSARVYALGIVEDISARKLLEEEILRAKELAEASNRAKDEFLANVSHEIRTPMNAIVGMTDLVLDTALTKEQRQLLGTARSAAGSLLAIINDLLDFSKIEAGKLALDCAELRLRAVIADTMRALAIRAHRKGLELVCDVRDDVPDVLMGDAGRLRQVLINLVSNAVTFTAQGEVVVVVHLDAPSSPETDHGVTLRVSVRDTGIGIPTHKQAAIFRAFEQEDNSTTRRYGGTGLGLTIASQLVAMMGGAITVQSESGRGSTFTFTARFGRQTQAAQSPVGGWLNGHRVLVADDNASVRKLLERWLSARHMNPTMVTDGVAAMDALWRGVAAGRPYDLVLLDARMPDTDGFTLAAKIRESPEHAATRIILLASGDGAADLERLRALDVGARLLKPVPEDELFDSIDRVMSGRDLESEPSVPASPAVAQMDPGSATPLHILVAEDDLFSGQLVERVLVRGGHEVRWVTNGREALSLIDSGRFDLLLLDLHMPELDGFQVIGRLRGREAGTGERLPVIALTARGRAADRDRCLSAGMDDFLIKPIDRATVMAAVARVVRARRAPASPPADSIAAQVLLGVCGEDPLILAGICEAARQRLPEGLQELDDAFRDGDATRLREVAHRLSGILAAFSPSAGALAVELEEQAARGELAPVDALIGRLREVAPRLMKAMNALTIEDLQRSLDIVTSSTRQR
jgi:PAS domain S-box-containing protein